MDNVNRVINKISSSFPTFPIPHVNTGFNINKRVIIIGVMVFVILVGSGSYILRKNAGNNANSHAIPVVSQIIPTNIRGGVCSTETKVCPDGATVGRIGPNCKFAPCPPMLTGSEQPKIYEKPWSSYEGRVCDYSGCYTSEIEQQNQYWIDQAIEKKSVNLCNNSLGLDSIPLGRTKEQSIYLCKAAYAIGVGDLEYCRNLDKEVQYVGCIQKFAAEYHKPEICDEIKTPGYENLNVSIIDACKKEASK